MGLDKDVISSDLAQLAGVLLFFGAIYVGISVGTGLSITLGPDRLVVTQGTRTVKIGRYRVERFETQGVKVYFPDSSGDQMRAGHRIGVVAVGSDGRVHTLFHTRSAKRAEFVVAQIEQFLAAASERES